MILYVTVAACKPSVSSNFCDLSFQSVRWHMAGAQLGLSREKIPAVNIQQVRNLLEKLETVKYLAYPS